MRTLVVVPTYNEIENIEALVRGVLVHPVDLLVVDDGSPDGTGQLVERLRPEYGKKLSILHRAGKQGLGTAYVAGLRWGLDQGYECLIELDADFSHDPAYLPTMMERLKTHDFVIGSRYTPGGGTKNWGLGRKILSRGGSLYSRLILGVSIGDFTGGFNGWHRKVLEAVKMETLRSDGYSFQIELKYRAAKKGFTFCEFPIVFVDRKVGQSKMNKRIVLEALLRVWSLRAS